MTAPLLVFDSGVGGLSVLAPIRALLPGVPVVYAADNAGFPYGTKTEAEIASRVPALLGRLVERYRPRLVVIACNTASTIALAPVRAALDLPVVGTVPAIKPAAEASRSRVIGVLGTAATVRQPYVDRLSAEFAADCRVIRYGSSVLVDLAEAKLRGIAPDPAAIARELAGLLDQPDGDKLDTVALACTHFPLLAEELAAASPRPLTFVDGGRGIARRVAYLLSNTAPVLSSTPAQDHRAAPPASSRAVFTRPSPDVDALRPALHSYGLDEIDFL
ncbi:glutamate racemase [Polymorphobacter megasporae]|uniref:glutamate racemase n=1 Tax=Glacieibacterium megasporae TaxID=2835787 RepID=UPI001C1E4CE3|nr:glutamate racemase [Polymorphobacter megasporae]UAJ09290.1 glutamate racemase [Polymorphobacter megasporae]